MRRSHHAHNTDNLTWSGHGGGVGRDYATGQLRSVPGRLPLLLLLLAGCRLWLLHTDVLRWGPYHARPPVARARRSPARPPQGTGEGLTDTQRREEAGRSGRETQRRDRKGSRN